MTLLLFPLKAELDFFVKHFSHEKYLCAVAGQGKVQFALMTQTLCSQHPEIETIFCLGSAGALDPSLKPGDVVVGEFSVEHDYKVLSRTLALPAFPGNDSQLTRFKNLNHPQVRFGKIASGDEDIMDDNRRRELQAATQALCVAWEGAGGARAAKHLGKPYLEIRAITDLAQASTRQEFESHLEKAMASLAALMTALVARKD